jgi:ABC-2 type transport system permease protein
MRTVYKIARTELRTLFYSPIAWFLMIVFLIQCGLAYTYHLDSNAKTQELNGYGLQFMTQLTERIFGGREGLFSSVMEKLYLYIPLLTMGLISREINGGTIKLLYSSPVKVQAIIFGKYLAMMIYSLVLVCIIGIFLVAGLFQINSVDYGMLISSALGFYLLLCAYSAIGLFMSCLSTYQVVAAVSTFVMIGILSYIGKLWQGIDFVRDLTYFLSLSGRTGHMLFGMITTKDVLYFLLIIYIFLGLSIYKLKAGRESKPALVKIGRYAFVVVSALLVGYLSSRPSLIGYADVTANKSRTLTPNTQKIISEIGKEPLEVTAYNNILGKFSYFGLPEQRNSDLERWEPYLRFKPDIILKYVNYYDTALDDSYIYRFGPGKSTKELAEANAKNWNMKLSQFKTPEEIHKIIDLKPEMNRYVMQLKYKDRTTFLRLFDDQETFPGETEVSAAFKRLLAAKLPKVAFLTGDLERSIDKIGDRNYKTLTTQTTFRYALINQGFDVDTLSLATQDIPADISTLVIADPKTSLSAEALSKIQAYMDKGGNLLIAGEPGKQVILNPLLQKLGVQLMEGAIVQQSKEFSPDLVLPNITSTAAGFSKQVMKGYKDSVHVSMPGATGLDYADTGAFEIKPLLTTDVQHSWMKKDKLVVDSADIQFSAANGDVRKPVPTALSLTRKINGREQRIVVTGDADFMSNVELGRNNIRVANFSFNTALFSWLSYGEFPIDTSRPDAKDKRVNVSVDQVEAFKIVFVWILPGVLLAFATILLIRRKRK